MFSTFLLRQNDGGSTVENSLFCWISGIIGTSEKKGGPLMPQSEMEALMQLQKETIKSLRHLVDSQRLTIEQMAKSYEEQTAQMNQTIANLNETVEYLKKKLFASSSEKTKKDGFPGQMDLFNEAEAAGLLLSWSRLWRRLLAVINVRQRNRRLPEKRSLQGFLWWKFPAPCRMRTGAAPTAML